jgi:hypothetical protein
MKPTNNSQPELKGESTKEEILDNCYMKGMHWKSVNRERALIAMESYAIQRLAQLTEENRVLKESINNARIIMEGVTEGSDIQTVLYKISNTLTK